MKLKRVSLFVVELPLGVVTSTSTVPAAWAGVVAVIVVAELTVKELAAVPPKVTAVAPLKFAPMIVTLVFPVSGPLPGLTCCTCGVGAGT
jgi:hypothetical protein